MPRKLASLLGSDGTLQALFNRASELARLQRLIHALMEPDLAAHCRLANVARDTLILEADGPAWATRLRFQGPGLVSTLRKYSGLEAVSQIRIRVRPAETPVLRRRRPEMSAQGAKALRGAADAIDDPSLSAALRRLADRRKK